MEKIKSQFDYDGILSKGKETAVSSAALAELLWFCSVRMLQKDIEKARESGQLILLVTTGGYYLPADDKEAEEFIATLKRRALMTLRAIKHARHYLNETKGQMSLETEREENDGKREP